MGTSLFWAVTQRVLAVPYRRFATTYRPQLQEWRINYGPLKTEPTCWTAITCCVIAQRFAGLVYFT